MPRWDPVLSGNLRIRSKKVVDEIYSYLASLSPDALSSDISLSPKSYATGTLARGTAGIALFFLYYWKSYKIPKAFDLAQKFASHSASVLADQDIHISLFNGFSGIAWMVSQFSRDADSKQNNEIDKAIVLFLKNISKDFHYDVISGVVGIGLYLISRIPNVLALEGLVFIVDYLERIAIYDTDGVTWHTPSIQLDKEARNRFQNGYFNLGVAHGIPGVIGLLAQILALKISPIKTKFLLDGAIKWLATKRNFSSKFYSVPPWYGPDIDPETSRLSWCYGDLGVSMSLLCAAKCTMNIDLQNFALDIARVAAKRGIKDSGVVDGCICHGAAGVGHLFNRIYQISKEPLFKQKAILWFKHTLDIKMHTAETAGFLILGKRQEKLVWINEVGLLMGVSGIGLAMLAAFTREEPSWDCIFLASCANPNI